MIREKTMRLRHEIAWALMEAIAPKLKADLLQAKLLLRDLPRPFTVMLKEHYKNTPLTGLEIGYGLGENAENLLQELNIKKLYSVDPYYMTESYQECGRSVNWYLNPNQQSVDRFNRLKATGKIEFIKAFSDDAWANLPNDLDFVYIDGNHEFSYCLSDIINAFEHVKDGGFIGGHDFANSHYKVADAVFIFSQNRELMPNMHYPDFWFQKEAQP